MERYLKEILLFSVHIIILFFNLWRFELWFICYFLSFLFILIWFVYLVLFSVVGFMVFVLYLIGFLQSFAWGRMEDHAVICFFPLFLFMFDVLSIYKNEELRWKSAFWTIWRVRMRLRLLIDELTRRRIKTKLLGSTVKWPKMLCEH